MKKVKHFGLFYCALMLVSCSSVEHGLTDGYYTVKSTAPAPRRVYIALNDSILTMYPLRSGSKEVDTSQKHIVSLVPEIPGDVPLPLRLVKKSIDMDVGTVLFKYRFSTNTLPNQLNSNLNATVYAGYRTDFFHLRDAANPLKRKEKRLRHFEMDGGLFAGIGSAAINPSVTNSRLDTEYDGLVLQKGAALFFGSGNFTLGIGLGTDSLLDKNKSLWIYQEKWWLGLLVGINISG